MWGCDDGTLRRLCVCVCIISTSCRPRSAVCVWTGQQHSIKIQLVAPAGLPRASRITPVAPAALFLCPCSQPFWGNNEPKTVQIVCRKSTSYDAYQRHNVGSELGLTMLPPVYQSRRRRGSTTVIYMSVSFCVLPRRDKNGKGKKLSYIYSIYCVYTMCCCCCCCQWVENTNKLRTKYKRQSCTSDSRKKKKKESCGYRRRDGITANRMAP